MASNFVDAKTYRSKSMRCDFHFKSRSDARLAGLFLDNMDNFPIPLLRKVFDVVLDPGFKSDEVHFKDLQDMFAYLSGCRKKVPTPLDPSEPQPKPLSGALGRSRVPPLVLSLVVDNIVENRVSLGDLAMEPYWSTAFERNGEPFHALALVHPSWTPIVQKGLRQRVVVPYDRIKKFLINPLCGPWIQEMMIFWTIDEYEGGIGPTDDDVFMLDVLLARAQNIRSLSFTTGNLYRTASGMGKLRICDCFDIISTRLPTLRSLWLKHHEYPVPLDTEDYRSSFTSAVTCEEIRDLCFHLPKMQSLQFLSIRSWSGRWKTHKLDQDKHPSVMLKSIEVDVHHETDIDALVWLLRPRLTFYVQSLFLIVNEDVNISWLEQVLSSIQKVRLCTTWDDCESPIWDDVEARSFKFSGYLDSLDLFIMDESDFPMDYESIVLPSSLERLSLHFEEDELQWDDLTSAVEEFFLHIGKSISLLPHFRGLFITVSPRLSGVMMHHWDTDELMHRMEEGATSIREEIHKIPRQLVNVCEERGIELMCIENAFPKRWILPPEIW